MSQFGKQPFGGSDEILLRVLQNLQAIAGEVKSNALLLADTRKRMARLEAIASLAAAGRSPKLPISFQSQYGEDALVWSLLDGQLSGFYVEVGAFDGWNYSTTYALEAVGWTGLLVEPIPERFEACRKARPGSRVVNAALSRKGSSGETTFTVVSDQYGGMLSFNTTNRDHADTIAATKVPTRAVTVPLTTMDALLEGHQGDIDFASIDVEGGEADLLDGFDLARWKPKVVFIEDNNRNDKAAQDHMRNLPYHFAGWYFVNAVYVRNDLPMLRRRSMELLNP